MATRSGVKRRGSRRVLDLSSDADDDAIVDSELVPSSLASIGPILRVANDIESDNPRVAYLCRFHAFEKAVSLDPTSSGRGVSQFKTYLLRRLEKEEEATVLARSDPREITIYYRRFYEENIKDGVYTKRPEEIAKDCQMATVLYDVLRTVVPPSKIDPETKRIADYVAEKSDCFAHYNILPLFALNVKPAIVELPAIKAAMRALRNVGNLPIPRSRQTVSDILDWVSAVFGFQKSNVENQREHLILLLANINARKNIDAVLSSLTVKTLGEKVFKNYHSWCKYLDCSSNNRCLARLGDQGELIYIALYFLIWGEASSIRFMPECLCYIFHNMADEVNMVVMNGTIYPSKFHDEEYFLQNVIRPIFDVLHKEARRSKYGRESYSSWRNYDDLNEYFWSQKCFRLGWPMNRQADFFRQSNVINPSNEQIQMEGQRQSKTNFVEIRTFFHLYRSFDRLWKFFILAFQAMVIFAWKTSGSVSSFFDTDVFGSVLSLFITSTILDLLQASLDVVMVIRALKSLNLNQITRYLLRLMVAALWVVIVLGHGHWLTKQSLKYVVAVYLIPNLLSATLFLFPPLGRVVELSNWRIVALLFWWAQPKSYVGREMHEDILTVLKYTSFWMVLLISKLGFSYYVEILPLVEPTKVMMEMSFDNYEWHELFSLASRNIFVIAAIWAPIVFVYLMDTQIWFAIFSTFFGGIQGVLSHLGEIRTVGMLRSRFEAISLAFGCSLMPPSSTYTEKKILNPNAGKNDVSKFRQMWNEFICSMRSDDIISNRERDLLLFPRHSHGVSVIQWPLYLLASKIPIGIDIAKNFKGHDDKDFFRVIKNIDYMESTVIEFYEMLREVIHDLLEDEADKMILTRICNEISGSIGSKRFLNTFRMSGLLHLSQRLKSFIRLLPFADEEDNQFCSRIITLLQDVLEIITQDIMINGHEMSETVVLENKHIEKVLRFSRINMRPWQDSSWKEKVLRLDLLLTIDESSMNVPQNLEARRRVTFFANSLFMNMPLAPEVRDMLSFSVLTPYYKEDVLFTEEELNKENEDGISSLVYLQKIYPDEWQNFMERLRDLNSYSEHKTRKEFTRLWASCRAQTLHRTVRGMMNYRAALQLQCFLESARDIESSENLVPNEKDGLAFLDQARALADLKFTYIVSCQVYGAQKKSSDHRDQVCYNNILKLMLMYPSMRVAYIDQREETVNGRSEMVYYSVLVKGGYKLDEEIYRIKLPGPPTGIGEARAENQNSAIIFTRGEALQSIDMNQDNYFEEAYKMRNVLEEFVKPRRGERKPTILGLKEHIFTGSVSSPSWFMSSQETNVISVGKRTLADPLRVRFHYGHPDIFDRIFHITRGGIGKASRGLNFKDTSAGFNSTLRGGLVTYHEYIQVGKGCDMNINQISLHEAMIAEGNGEQMLTRDIYRLGCRFDFFRMLSFYFTTVGYYISCMITVLSVYVFLYGRLYLVLSGAEREIVKNLNVHRTKALEQALATQSVAQFGFLSLLPMAMEIGLENGFREAMGDFIIMQLQLVSVFFAFQLGTKAHYFGRRILHGGSKYRPTGRGFVTYHVRYAENYRCYSRSHFVKGLELLALLVVYMVYREPHPSSNLHAFITFSMWLIVASWLYAPFVFNPCGFDLEKAVDDWADWKSWMGSRSVGTLTDRSWESWWDREQEHLRYTNIRGRAFEIFLACRFFLYQYGIVYHLDISRRSTSLQVYGFSWVFVAIVLLALKIISTARRRVGNDFQLLFRLIKALLFLGFVSAIAILFAVSGLSVSDIFASLLAFFPTLWAIVLIGQAMRPLFKVMGAWESIKEIAMACEYIMGLIIFIPIAVLSLFPFVSEIQTRLLFNQAISRGLQISTILPERMT